MSDHFGITGIIYDSVPRPVDEDEHGTRAAWDERNRIALEKLRFYVTTRVDDTVRNGDELTAREYYVRLQALFLRTGSESVASLHKRLANCTYSMQPWNGIPTYIGQGLCKLTPGSCIHKKLR